MACLHAAGRSAVHAHAAHKMQDASAPCCRRPVRLTHRRPADLLAAVQPDFWRQGRGQPACGGACPSTLAQAATSVRRPARLTAAGADALCARVQRLAVEQGKAFIAPYDDPYTIAGQGTVGTEVLRQISTQDLAALHAIFVPVGGGGLIAGIAAYVKALYPQVR